MNTHLTGKIKTCRSVVLITTLVLVANAAYLLNAIDNFKILTGEFQPAELRVYGKDCGERNTILPQCKIWGTVYINNEPTHIVQYLYWEDVLKIGHELSAYPIFYSAVGKAIYNPGKQCVLNISPYVARFAFSVLTCFAILMAGLHYYLKLDIA